MKKVLFIQEESVLLRKSLNGQGLSEIQFYPGVIQNLSRIAVELNFELYLLYSNEKESAEGQTAQNNMLSILKNEGVEFYQTVPREGAGFQMPQFPASLDVANSYLITSQADLVQSFTGMDLKTINLGKAQPDDAVLTAYNWSDIYRFLKSIPRTAQLTRVTAETNISVQLNLDGSGKSSISTGLGFFDHMLDQVAKHGEMDLEIQVKGDLHIDEHHTIEDVAIVLGETMLKALGNKKGIERYGFLLPMDDCLAQVAIDFGGRPWLVWETTFRREKIGEMPTEMFMHFFKSFSDHAKCNLNIQATGENEHHKIEAIFKAFAKAIKMAVAKTNNFSIPSTKGMV